MFVSVVEQELLDAGQPVIAFLDSYSANLYTVENSTGHTLCKLYAFTNRGTNDLYRLDDDIADAIGHAVVIVGYLTHANCQYLLVHDGDNSTNPSEGRAVGLPYFNAPVCATNRGLSESLLATFFAYAPEAPMPPSPPSHPSPPSIPPSVPSPPRLPPRLPPPPPASASPSPPPHGNGLEGWATVVLVIPAVFLVLMVLGFGICLFCRVRRAGAATASVARDTTTVTTTQACLPLLTHKCNG